MKLFNRLTALLSILLVAALLTVSPAAAADSVAKIYSLEGEATVTQQGGTSVAAQEGSPLVYGDTIKVGRASRVGIEFADGTFVRLGSMATLVLNEKNNAPEIALQEGDAHFLSREPVRYPSITTPTVTAAIRGTEFTIFASKLESVIAVYEGQVSAENAFGALLISSGEAARIKLNSAPVKDTTIKLRDSAQWTAFVPFLGSWQAYAGQRSAGDPFVSALKRLDSGEDPNVSLGGADGEFIKAARLVNAGKLRPASMHLWKLDSKSAPSLRLLKARLALNAGEVTDARVILGDLTQTDLGSEANATLALASLQAGNLEEAKAYLEKARSSAGPNSSVPAVASLLCQASRNFDCALTEIDSLGGESDYAKVRKAEILFAGGEISQARELLESAKESGYKDTVAGFLSLASMEREKAEEYFNRAREIQPGSALPRLGLGLLAINRNDLETGRKFLTEAAQLEPNNAAVRSYLGKLFSESGNENLARREYAEAMRLDPNDPTPWLYRSYTNVSENRPVDALYDIEQSIKLNQDRGVFRSSLLLDQDQAVRSSNLSQIYRELGFFELGRVEAIKALSLNYRNYSAHRLLAESQDTLFLADAALSERRQADVLAPLSLNLFDSIGASTSFGDYTGLFDRDQTKVSIGTVYDSTVDLYVPDMLVAGKDGKFGYAMSVEGGIDHGSAKNNSGQDYRVSGSVQYQPDFDTRIGGRGFLQYVRTDNANALEQEERFRRFLIDLDAAHELSASTTVLVRSAVERSLDHGNTFFGVDSILSTQIFQGQSDTVIDDILYDQRRQSHLTSTQTEAQVVNELSWVSSVFGAVARTEHRDNTEESFVLEDSLGELTGNNVILPSDSVNNLQSYSTYLYNTFRPLESLQINGGLSYERVERELREISPFIGGTDIQEKLSPKAGFLYAPMREVTVRGAYLEGLVKSSLQDEVSLEPTQVSGITQRFNDLPGTSYRLWGSGVDVSPGVDTHVGAEWIRRFLAEPYDLTKNEFTVNFDDETIGSEVQLVDSGDFHIEQDLVRAYLYQVFSPQLAGALEYRYTKERLTDPEAFSRTADNTFRSTLRYFFPSGFFLLGRGSWRYQDRIGGFSEPDGSDAAWLFDAGVGYRLSNRGGSINLEVRNIFGQDVHLEQLSGIEPFLSSDTTVLLAARLVF